MRTIATALALACVALASTAHASEQGDVMEVVHQYVDGLSQGHADSTPGLCMDSGIILDDFPPHVWEGAGACARWVADFKAYTATVGISHVVGTLGEPRHVYVKSDRAYVVAPASFAYVLKGKPMRNTGATWTFALQKQAAGWRITGWAWADGQDVAVEPSPAH